MSSLIYLHTILLASVTFPFVVSATAVSSNTTAYGNYSYLSLSNILLSTGATIVLPQSNSSVSTDLFSTGNSTGSLTAALSSTNSDQGISFDPLTTASFTSVTANLTAGSYGYTPTSGSSETIPAATSTKAISTAGPSGPISSADSTEITWTAGSSGSTPTANSTETFSTSGSSAFTLTENSTEIASTAGPSGFTSIASSSGSTSTANSTGTNFGHTTTDSEISSSLDTTASSSTGPSIDAATSTFIATISSAASEFVTSTITSAPSGLSATTLSGSFSTNGWVTTTGLGFSTTILPIIVTGGRGIEFWGLPDIADVKFSFPGLPSFHLPCVNIFGISAGDCSSLPETDSDDNQTSARTATTQTSTQSSSSSSGSCTVTQTASDCRVGCASSASGSSCASYTTACPSTITGCSVIGMTSTISSSGCSLPSASGLDFKQPTQTACNAGCTFTPTPGKSIDTSTTTSAATGPDIQKRTIAGRIVLEPLEKRDDGLELASFGGCQLATPAGWPLTRPAWPQITATMLRPESNGDDIGQYTAISRYDRVTLVGCVHTTTRLDARSFLKAPSWEDISQVYQPDNEAGSLDHCYEKTWLRQFFNSIMGGNRPLTCDQANAYFFPTSDNCHYNLLQDVWNALASNTNLDFIAMSKYANNMKGQFFDPRPGYRFEQRYVGSDDYQIPETGAGWQWSLNPAGGVRSAKGALNDMTAYWEQVLYGVLEMQSDNMVQLIDRTNNRIYRELTNLDQLINTGLFGDTTAYQNAFSDGVAGAYKTFMTNTILPQINAPPTYLTSLMSQRIGPMLQSARDLYTVLGTDSTAWSEYWNWALAQNGHYWNGQNYAWEYTFAFSWDADSVAKREVGDIVRRAGSCPLPTTGSVSGVSITSSASSVGVTSSTAASSSSTITSSSAAISSSAAVSPTEVLSSTTSDSSTAVTSVDAATSTTATSATSTEPHEFTPTGTDTQEDGCIYVGCPSAYYCNNLGNCMEL